MDYPIVMLDCEMPDLDGYATAAEIRRSEGKDRHAIIVAMTAHALDGTRLRCLDAGMDEYLAKPVTLQALSAVLERCALLARKANEPPAASEVAQLPSSVAGSLDYDDRSPSKSLRSSAK